MRGQRQGRRDLRVGGFPHQTSPYLLGYVFKFISCQLTLEGQSDNVHAALTMIMKRQKPFTFSLRQVQVHFCQPCAVGLIIAISDKNQVEVWEGDVSLSKIRSPLGGRMSLSSALSTTPETTEHTAPCSSTGAIRASDHRKHITQTPFPQPSRGHSWTGHPQSRISAPESQPGSH